MLDMLHENVNIFGTICGDLKCFWWLGFKVWYGKDQMLKYKLYYYFQILSH